jgi:hypothetical protein
MSGEPYVPHPLRRRRENYYKKLPTGGVLVARPTRWGNPFVIDMSPIGLGYEVRYQVRPGTRPDVIADGLTVEEAVARAVTEYRAWLRCAPRGIEIAAAAKKELKGREVYCYCPLDRPCHADVLAEIANEGSGT